MSGCRRCRSCKLRIYCLTLNLLLIGLPVFGCDVGPVPVVVDGVGPVPVVVDGVVPVPVVVDGVVPVPVVVGGPVIPPEVVIVVIVLCGEVGLVIGRSGYMCQN